LAKLNCWEFTKCGREQGGLLAEEMGVCHAATVKRMDGINSGKNGGRICWAIAGTLCEGKLEGTHASRSCGCRLCDFYIKVKEEEGKNFIETAIVRKKSR
jgi:hypothetical protein